ncbi:MAG: ATP-binding protein [Bacteroidota bacterium]|jgi:signal transduction histidine kinase/CheY-like chemotaxis protein
MNIEYIQGCSLFNGISHAIIEEILFESEIKIYQPGEVLNHKGDIPSALFIIESGIASIYNEDVLLAELPPLSMMGESVIADGHAVATIVAKSTLTVVEIKKDKFYELSHKYPALVFNVFNTTFSRLRSSNDSALIEARNRERKLEQEVQERTKELNETLDELTKTNYELNETKTNLIQTQKFRDQFMANMSHEIRTPMNAIVGLTNLLTKSPLNTQQAKYLEVIKKSGENLLVIINDILDLSKIEAGKMELEQRPFPLRSTLENVRLILNIRAEEKGVFLNEIIDSNLPDYVVGDETRFTQVITNLVGNAIKFTEKGGVTLKAEVLNIDAVNARIKFSVIDTGIGIPQDKLAKIFESFSQASDDTTRKFGGTGLGLTISKQLVELHHSSLEVTSVPDVGSTFYFTVDFKIAEAPIVKEQASEANGVDVTNKRILLVEDNMFNQMVAVDSIKEIFPTIEIDVADHGKKALAMVQEKSYTMVFMDIQLPDMDGFQITREIRKLGFDQLRICAMTASVLKEQVDACFDAGMDDYMMKPFTPELLKEKLIINLSA